MNKILLSATILAAAATAADLPVREVTLYKNGIGYFVRGGELKAGEPARLEFKAEEMNDVLKSLLIFEEGGGKLSGLRYDSSEPLASKLTDFPFRIEAAKPLSVLLDQLKGARVELKTGPESLSGVIVAAREVAATQAQPAREELTLLLDSGELRTVDLHGVTSTRFADPVLQAQLVKYLATVAEGRSKEKRSVYIDSAADRARSLSASYVVPAPVWKSSYRLAFGSAGDPTLEGWAIVDNTTGEDWTKVRLALVSGRPISFISNLYEPRTVQRQTAELAEEAGETPEVYADAMGAGSGGGIGTSAAPPPPPPHGNWVLNGGEAYDRGGAVATQSLASNGRGVIQVAALVPGAAKGRNLVSRNAAIVSTEAAERGELFEYRFDEPVTVRNGESAMVPFLKQKIAARKLLIFSATATDFPRNAAEITNSTGETLDGGPITVFDGDTYAGEALMETVKGGDKRLISYAVDLGTHVTTALDSSDEVVREIHVRGGTLTASTATRKTKTYTVRNVDAKPKTLIVEHAIGSDSHLISPKAAETTASAYRFEVKLAPQATEKLVVEEEEKDEEETELSNASPDELLVYVKNKDLDANARKQLDRVAAQQREIADNNAAISRADAQIAELISDQNRIRQNITTLNAVSGQQEQVQNYSRRLAQQEADLARLRDQQAERKQKKVALQSALDDLIEGMTF
jgi:hypothetical protein